LSEGTFKLVKGLKARKLPPFELPGHEENVVGYLIRARPGTKKNTAKV
jgi:hypothetical protein